MPDSPPALTPVLGRRERRKLEVRNRIYNAARELFAKQGFDATPVDEIAELADVAPATFFNHFHSKHALLRLMTAEVVEHLHAMTLDNLDRPGAPLDRLDRFVRRAAEDISSNRRGRFGRIAYDAQGQLGLDPTEVRVPELSSNPIRV